jgi:hypothetical protein
VGFFSQPFFSPASICPSGFTNACSYSKNVWDEIPTLTYGADVANQMTYLLQDGDTAIGCCPTGFSCDSYFALTCTKAFSAGQTVTGVSYGRSCSPTPTTLSFSTGILDSLNIVNGQQLNVWLLQNPGTDNHTSSSSGSILSTGAKIGLGVGIPLGILIAAALIFIYCHRRRNQRKENRRQRDRQAQNRTDEPVLPPHLEKPELQGSDAPAGGIGAGQAKTKAELDAKTAVPEPRVSEHGAVNSSELDGSKATTDPTATHGKAELDAAPSATITNLAELSGEPYRYELEAGDDAKWKTREV